MAALGTVADDGIDHGVTTNATQPAKSSPCAPRYADANVSATISSTNKNAPRAISVRSAISSTSLSRSSDPVTRGASYAPRMTGLPGGWDRDTVLTEHPTVVADGVSQGSQDGSAIPATDQRYIAGEVAGQPAIARPCRCKLMKMIVDGRSVVRGTGARTLPRHHRATITSSTTGRIHSRMTNGSASLRSSHHRESRMP